MNKENKSSFIYHRFEVICLSEVEELKQPGGASALMENLLQSHQQN